MDRQPVLEGERLVLRPLRPDDRDGLFAVARDPELWALHPLSDRWRPEVFAALFDELLTGGALVVVDRASARLIGASRFLDPDPAEDSTIEIGTSFIAREFWGRGYNAEMKRLMLEHAFRFLERVVFRVGVGNARSRRAMDKIGARLVGEPFMLLVNGREMPHVRYAITRQSFTDGPLARSGQGVRSAD